MLFFSFEWYFSVNHHKFITSDPLSRSRKELNFDLCFRLVNQCYANYKGC